MERIELGYGRGTISLDYDEARFRVLTPPGIDEVPLSDGQIGAALDAPINSPPLEELVDPDSTVLLVVSDSTRASASSQIVHLLVRRLVAASVHPSNIRTIFATGIHRAVTEHEKRELLTPFIVQRIRTLDHNAYSRDDLVSLGVTSRGTPIELNRALTDHSNVILTGSIGFHYFAGFTGGRKSICPGLASARTIEATHMLAMDFEKGGRRNGVGTGLLDGNAVNEECEEIAGVISPSFLVNTIVNEQGNAIGVYAGDWRTAHRKGCSDYLASHSFELPAPKKVVIASCGGFPWDINMIQAHKALDAAAQACSEGGTIILLAQCSDGLGRPDFLKWFDSKSSRELEERLRSGYEVNGQTAWSLLLKAESFRIFLVSDLPAHEVEKMRMIPVQTLDEALRHISTESQGLIMPRGAAYLPLLGATRTATAQ